MDAYEAAGKEAGRKLYKNVESSIKQVLATTPHETPTIRTLAPPSQKLYKFDEPDTQDELISDVLLWTPTHGCARVGRPARTYIQQLCEDTGCNPEDLPEAMNDREKWRETVRDIRAGGASWWWWWLGRAIMMLEDTKLVRTPRTSLTRRFCSLFFLSVWLQKKIIIESGILAFPVSVNGKVQKNNYLFAFYHWFKLLFIPSYNVKRTIILTSLTINKLPNIDFYILSFSGLNSKIRNCQ